MSCRTSRPVSYEVKVAMAGFVDYVRTGLVLTSMNGASRPAGTCSSGMKDRSSPCLRSPPRRVMFDVIDTATSVLLKRVVFSRWPPVASTFMVPRWARRRGRDIRKPR
jgi:hypothetical protein